MSMTRYGYGRRAENDPSYLVSLLQRTINRLGILTADMDYVAERLDENKQAESHVLRQLDAATGSTEAAKLLIIEAVRKLSVTIGPRAVPQHSNKPPRLPVNRYHRQNHSTFDPLHGDQGNKS